MYQKLMEITKVQQASKAENHTRGYDLNYDQNTLLLSPVQFTAERSEELWLRFVWRASEH